jgi:Tol biopolymer transport system component
MKSPLGRRMRKLVLLVSRAAAFLVVLAAPIRTAHATFPGTNGQITFGKFNRALGGTQVFVSNPDGSHQVQLSTFPSEISDWSPDGSRVAFDFFDGQTVQIGAINPDATGFVELTTDENAFHGEPAWSPDGTRLAIESDAGNFPAGEGIYVIDASTGKVLSRVTANPFASFDGFPRWSPDGNWITFVRSGRIHPSNGVAGGFFDTAIFLVRPDGTGLRQLTQWGLHAAASDWSPDGSKIVFFTNFNFPPSSNIYTIHPDGSDLTLIVKSAARSGVGFPRWSPDGSKIIFAGDITPGPQGLWTVNSDGSGLTEIPGTNGLFFPAWGTHALQ